MSEFLSILSQCHPHKQIVFLLISLCFRCKNWLDCRSSFILIIKQYPVKTQYLFPAVTTIIIIVLISCTNAESTSLGKSEAANEKKEKKHTILTKKEKKKFTLIKKRKVTRSQSLSP